MGSDIWIAIPFQNLCWLYLKRNCSRLQIEATDGQKDGSYQGWHQKYKSDKKSVGEDLLEEDAWEKILCGV